MPKIFHVVFASVYGFVVLADWRFCTLQNAYLYTADCCELGLSDSLYVQCYFDGESGRHSVIRRFSVHSNWSRWFSVSCIASIICHTYFLPVRPAMSFFPDGLSSSVGQLGVSVLKKKRREPDVMQFT